MMRSPRVVPPHPPSRRSAIARAVPQPAPRSPSADLVVAAVAGLIAVGVAQVADLLTFVRMVAVAGIGAELNPIVARTATAHGLEVLAVAKIGLVAFVVASVVLAARAYPRVAGLVLTVGTVAGLVGAASNIVALM